MMSRGEVSFESSLNESLTSEAHMNMLAQKLEEISQNNKKVSKENERLRNERNEYRLKYESLKTMMASNQNYLSPERNQSHDLSNSNIFDRDTFDKIRE